MGVGPWQLRFVTAIVAGMAIMAAVTWTKASTSSVWNFKADEGAKSGWGVKPLVFMAVMLVIAFTVIGAIYPGVKILGLVLASLGYAALSAVRLVLKKTSLGAALMPAVIAAIVLGTVGGVPHHVTKAAANFATQTGSKVNPAAKSSTAPATTTKPGVVDSDTVGRLQLVLNALHVANYTSAAEQLRELKVTSRLDSVWIDKTVAAIERHDVGAAEAMICDAGQKLAPDGLKVDPVCRPLPKKSG
jgi:hypothetical protein